MKLYLTHLIFILLMNQCLAMEHDQILDDSILLSQAEVEKWQRITKPPVSKEVLQWLCWENQENVFSKEFEPVKISYLQSHQLTDYKVYLNGAHDYNPKIAKHFLEKERGFIWPFHPTNTIGEVNYRNIFNEPQHTVIPFFSKKDLACKFFIGAYTASRSTVVFIEGLPLISLKLSTNFPTSFREMPSKADLRSDVKFSVIKSQLISVMDEHWGQSDPKLKILKDQLTIKDKDSENGFTIRDLSYLEKSGNYFLPAFSIPFIGGKIAQKFNESYANFWAKHYASAIGEAKAKLLLRYGMQMPSPSPQNILLELDQSLMPTGVVLFRDIGDFFYVPFVGTPIGTSAFGRKLESMGACFSSAVYPGFSTSVMNMELNSTGKRQRPGKTHIINEDYWQVYAQWLKAHNLAYWRFIQTSLDFVDLPRIEEIYQFQSSTKNLEESFQFNSKHSDHLPIVTEILKGEKGQQALRDFARKLAS